MAYTDPVGQFPLYWTRTDNDETDTDGDVLVDTSASVLANEVEAKFDLVSLAARVACPGAPDLFPNRTPYEAVYRISEGTIFKAEDGVVQQTGYRRVRVDPDIDVAQAGELFRERLVAAVRARRDAGPRMSADFSGGFDSTSLAFLAAIRDNPVLALTSEGPSGGSDDVERARRYADLNPNLIHHVVPTPVEHLPFHDLLTAGEEPHTTSLYLGPLRARLAVASEAGVDLHLVGEGGDVLLGAPPAYLADLAHRGDYTTLWRHCVAWARLRDRSPHRLFRRAVVLGRTSRRRALHTLARHVESGRSAATLWEDDWVCYWPRPRADWLTARARGRLAARVRKLADHDTDVEAVGDLVTRGWLRGQTLTQRAVRDAGREFGVRVHAPFLDSDVVRAGLSLSAHRRADPTVYKPLLREALSDLVPPAVLSHRVKGNYSKETYQGVRQAAPALRRLFADSAAADHGLIAPKPVLAALDDAIHGLPTPWASLSQVIAIELWLREFRGKVATT